MRKRLQERQKWSDMEVMKPSWPLKPGTLNVCFKTGKKVRSILSNVTTSDKKFFIGLRHLKLCSLGCFSLMCLIGLSSFLLFRTCVIIWWCFKQKYRKILQVYLIRGTRMCRRKCTEEHKKHDFLFFSINIIINQPSLSGFHLQSNLVQLETLTLAVSVCPAWSFSRSGHFCLMRSSISW